MIGEIFVSRSEIENQLSITAQVRSLLPKNAGYHIMTFGCSQNEADSCTLAGICEACGYKKVYSAKDASLVLINTCAIREHAELKVLSKTGQLKKLREKNPNMRIGICGCMAEEAHRREAILKSYSCVDFIFGTDKIHTLPSILLTALTERGKKTYVSNLPHNEFGIIAEGLPSVLDSDFKARVSIMYGCNNFCSYCVVPYVRGRERSRRSADVLAEVKSLVDRGYKEILLLGQNVNSYSDDMSFAELLDRAASFDGEYWVRFMTSHPKDASSELIDVIARNPKVAKQFHLPFQAGNDRILSLMNRKYTKEKYLEKAFEIKDKIKDVSVTTDVICGFPSETEEEFKDTLDVISKVGFDMIFTFLYSPRVRTPAARMEQQIPHEEKVKRFEALCELQNSIAADLNNKFIGETVRVLCDGESKGIFTGRTTQNKIVLFKDTVGKAKTGSFVDVEITETAPYNLTGIIK